MKRRILSPVKGLSVCFSIVASAYAATAVSPQADSAASATPAPLPGPDTSGPAEKIGTQGNWVKKREWLMKSHEAFAEIQDLVGHIEQVRTIFVEKLNNTNNILNTYYNGLGLSEGKIAELFLSIMSHLEHNRANLLKDLNTSQPSQDPELQAKIDIVESDVKHQRLALDQLKLDMSTVEDLGKSLVDRVTRVDEHIGKVQELFVSAQTIINELWDIIDHNKARSKYYELKITIFESLKAEQAYLQTDLLQDFDTVIQTIVSQIGRTEEAIKKIEADGFFIKNRSKRIKELRLKDVLSKEAAATTQQPIVRGETVQKVILERTLTERLYQKSIEGVAWLIDIFSWIKALIFGGPAHNNPPTPAKKPTPPTVAQAQAPAVAPLPAAQAALQQPATTT